MIDFDIRIDPKSVINFNRKMGLYKQGLETYSEKALQQNAEQYYEIIISRMGEYTGGEMIFGDVYWKELSPMWLAEKRKQGLVEEIWEATGEIKGAVRIFGVEKRPDELAIFVGLKNVSPSILEKAMRNEFGLGIPERALFEPAKREMVYNPAEINRRIEAFKVVSKFALGMVK
jgi:hypothetical protein